MHSSHLNGFPNVNHRDSWIKALKKGLWPWANAFLTDPPEGVVQANSPHMNKYRTFINSIRIKEVSLGHWRELKTIPKYFRNSPLSVVPKPEGGNRLIQNLSFPNGNSVNDQIPEADGKVVYDDISSLAKVIVVLHSLGMRGWVPWKLDVSRAFRNIPLHPLFALRNGVILSSRNKKMIPFIDSQACFGGRPFPRAFCSLQDMIGWIATERFGVGILLRFVDDHFGISPVDPGESEPRDMINLRKVFALLGVPTNDKFGSGEGLVIIGKEISYHHATIQFSKEKLIRYMTTCDHFARAQNMTLKEVEHIGGVFNYCVEICPIGKPYNTILDKVKAKYFGKNDRFSIEITDDMRESFRWWSFVLANRPIRYLLNEYWWTSMSADEVIFTDASTTGGLGFYRLDRREAYVHTYNPTDEVIKVLQGPRSGAAIHINTMELVAVFSAVQISGKSYNTRSDGGKARMLIMCDNPSVCDTIWKMSSKDFIMNELLKNLLDELKHIDLRVCHIDTKYNPADLLTKGSDRLLEFRSSFEVEKLFEFEPLILTDYLRRSNILTNQ